MYESIHVSRSWFKLGGSPPPPNETIDFVAENDQRYYAIDSPLAIPNGDFAVFVWVRPDVFTVNHTYYAFGGGTTGAANNLILGVNQDNIFTLAIDSGGGGPFSSNTPVTPWPKDGSNFLIGMQRRGANWEIYSVLKGDSVSGPNGSMSGAFSTGLINLPSMQIGNIIDFDPTRFWENPLGEFFLLINDSLSAADIEILAAGNPITSVRAVREIDLRFTADNATEPDLSGNGFDAAQNGVGYQLVTGFF